MTKRATNPKIFFSPHNDDESLFGAFTIMRELPHVVVVLKSFIQESRPQSSFATAAVRENETAAAVRIMGATWEQWDYRDDCCLNQPTVDAISERMLDLKKRGVEEVWGPAFHPQGHAHHNMVAISVHRVWGDAATYYTTYIPGERQLGEPVPYELWMVEKKLRALACYSSQLIQEWMVPHFMRGLEEYTEKWSG